MVADASVLACIKIKVADKCSSQASCNLKHNWRLREACDLAILVYTIEDCGHASIKIL